MLRRAVSRWLRAWPVPDLWAGAVAGHIAVSGRVLVDARCAAPARLGILARDGMLLRASELAYGDGITGLVQATGPAAGLTRLAEVVGTWRKLMTAPISRCSGRPSWRTASCSRPWGVDLMLVRAGDQITALALTGAYRPLPGRVGAALDQAIMRGCAAAAIPSFLARVACVLARPAGTAGTCES